jgi:hypothetical protein
MDSIAGDIHIIRESTERQLLEEAQNDDSKKRLKMDGTSYQMLSRI